MKVEVSTPEEYQGELMGDLNRRRGQIQRWKHAEQFVSSMRLFIRKYVWLFY